MAQIIVDLNKCNGDGTCADVCPANVFDIVEMTEYNNEKKAQSTRIEDCIGCMSCVYSCPTEAITIE